MPIFEPINDRFLWVDGENCRVEIGNAMNMQGKQTVEAILDCEFDELETATTVVFGKATTVDFSFSYDDMARVVATTTRNVTSYSVTASNGAVLPGARNIFRLLDDGTNLKFWMNGTLVGSVASSSDTLAKDTNDYFLGGELAVGNKGVKIYGAQIKYDGKIVFRFLPREESGTGVRDLSGYNQNIAIVGTKVEGTNFYWGTAWNREPMFSGSVIL